MATPHPLDPLSPDEISQIARVVREAFPASNMNFRVITLKEPPKDELIPYLEREHSESDTDQSYSNTELPARIAMVHVLISNADDISHNADIKITNPDGRIPLEHKTRTRFLDIRVNVDTSQIIHQEHLIGRHSYIDAEYMKAAEKACLADDKVQAKLKELKLPEGSTVVVEPWAYATDGLNEMTERITMCWFFLRLIEHPDSNYYAYPLDICAEISETLNVTRIYRLPSGENDRISDLGKIFDNERIHKTDEYHPDLVEQRTTTKPLQIVQPDGPSFIIKGNYISWEKWTFRVGFNYREGMTIHDVRFDNRSLFYRLSLAEMFVPYGDGRSPYQRKAAFDLGNDGAGINANNLRLGCDCLGHIKYFDGWHCTSNGEPLHMPNVICCHEIDDGILWKHTNFRTNNPVVARSRVLVLQTVVTVTNYEYIFAFHFKQDASIHYEVRATGIMSIAPIDIGGQVPFGTTVAPGAMAPYHQHLFSLRIDPALDGHRNSFRIDETVPMPYDTTDIPDNNAFGIGFTNRTSFVEHEGHFDLDHLTNRTFKIINKSRINPVTNTPVGYQLIPHYSQPLLAHASSYHARRSEFADHAVWVTRYHEDELFPAGMFTMQSAGGEGIASWIRKRREAAQSSNQNHNHTATNGIGDGNGDPSSVRNQDIVLWHTFGSTHIPRIEDWPVMPCEKMGVTLKPVNFFARNPGVDVAVAAHEGNGSVLVHGDGNGRDGCENRSCAGGDTMVGDGV